MQNIIDLIIVRSDEFVLIAILVPRLIRVRSRGRRRFISSET